jgi:hypothetical protein
VTQDNVTKIDADQAALDAALKAAFPGKTPPSFPDMPGPMG